MLEMEVRYQSYYYQVAGLRFCLRLPVNDPICNRLQHYEPFETDNENNEGLLFSLQVSPESACVPQSKLPFLTTFDEEDKTISLYHNQETHDDGCPYDIIYSLKASPDSVCFLEARSSFSEGHLCTEGDSHTRYFGVENALMTLFAFAASKQGIALQHASVVTNKGLAYLFLGKSGTGKSTHSRSWLSYIAGTKLLNDDNPAIGLDKQGNPRVWGTPWSGKTPCYINESAPIGGFVKLTQAPYNKIKRLDTLNAYVALLPTVSNMKWETSIANSVSHIIESIVERTKVFHLENLPNEEAALMSYEALTGQLVKHKVTMPNSILLGDVKQLITEGRKVTLKVKGNSMRPFIEGERDSVILTGSDNYQQGDIVLAEISEGNFVLHRIIQINEKEAILMGDGNLAKIERCDIHHVVAKVETIIRKGKQVNPNAYGQRTLAKLWSFLGPIRRYLLAIYRRL